MSVSGVSDNSVSSLKSFLPNIKQHIKLNTVLSDYADINNGLPQGSFLGPILFNVFLNDISVIKRSSMSNYADAKKCFHFAVNRMVQN